MWVGNGEIGGWLGRELGDDAGTPAALCSPWMLGTAWAGGR